MGIKPLCQEGVLFSTDTPPEVDALLQEAVVLFEDTKRAEAILKKAYAMAPERLEVYVAMYKFYFYKNLIDDAEHIVFKALNEAARQGGFPPEWSKLTPASAQWTPAADAPRAYLYSLKALAFISLRKNNIIIADDVLKKLLELDPEDQVGGSVIFDLAKAMLRN